MSYSAPKESQGLARRLARRAPSGLHEPIWEHTSIVTQSRAIVHITVGASGAAARQRAALPFAGGHVFIPKAPPASCQPHVWRSAHDRAAQMAAVRVGIAAATPAGACAVVALDESAASIFGWRALKRHHQRSSSSSRVESMLAAPPSPPPPSLPLSLPSLLAAPAADGVCGFDPRTMLSRGRARK